MPTPTYDKIEAKSLGSATSSVAFTVIPATYTDLVLIINGRSTRTADQYEGLAVQFNGDTASNYSYTTLAGNGSAASSFRASTQTNIEGRINTSVSSNTSPSSNILQVQNYSNSTTNKTALFRTNNSVEYYSVTATVGLWRSTSVISSITLFPTQSGSQFATGSTFTLYGIKAA